MHTLQRIGELRILREEMIVRFAVVIVNVGGTDAFFHKVEGRGYAFIHVGVPRIEHIVQTQMRQILKFTETLRAR